MTTATQEKPYRAAWLAERKKGLGASDTPAILGLDPYRSALDVYADKIGERDDEPANLPCRVGLALEGLIAEMYEEQTGRKIIDTQACFADDDFPFIRATVDGLTECGRIVEFKTTQSFAKGLEIGEEGTDEIPMAWLVQVTQQLIASRAKIADVAILRGNSKFTVHTVEYDDALANVILDKCVEFWDRVQTRNPPPATRGSDCRVLAKLYPEAEGETTLDGPASVDVAAWEEAKSEFSRWSKAADDAKARVLYALGPYHVGHLPDGRTLKRSVAQVKERTQTIKAYSQVRLTISKGAGE